MTPNPEEIYKIMASGQLGAALRGELLVFSTPPHINDDMRPSDHVELLKEGIYPLVQQYGKDFVSSNLENSIANICFDALGIFCAHRCFYIQMNNEKEGISPLSLERYKLPKILAKYFLEKSDALHNLVIRDGDLEIDRSYKVTLSGMRILEKDFGIDWGILLPKM